MMVQIKQHTGHVLFEYEQTGEVTLRDALEKGVQSETDLFGADLFGANLSRANLSRANLFGANLSEADLSRANLSGADLFGANLSRADLSGAHLSRANLFGANLSGADLSGANLSGANLSKANLSRADLSGAHLSGACLQEGIELIGDRPIFAVGPIGSRSDFMQAWLTDKGVLIQTGCFLGTHDEFIKKLAKTHSDNIHAKEYLAALILIDKHAELWTQRS